MCYKLCMIFVSKNPTKSLLAALGIAPKESCCN